MSALPRRLLGRIGPGANVETLFWAYLLWNGGFAVYLTVWTIFIQHLGADPFQIGLVVGGGAVARTLLSIPAGAAVDRFSPYPVMIGTMALPVAGMIGLCLVTAWWQALLAAVGIELSGLAIPAVSARIAAVTEPAARTRAFTYIFLIAPQVGLIAGPAASGFLADRAGFRAVFLTAAALFGLGLVLLAQVDRTAGHIRPADASMESGGLPADAAGSPIAMLRDPAIRTVVLLHVLVPLLPFTGFTLLANYLVSERGMTLTQIGTFGSVGAVAGLLAGLAISHWPPLGRPMFGLGVCLGSAALALLIFQLPLPAIAIAAGYALKAAANPVFSLLSAAAADVTPEQLRGRVYGLAETGAGIGDIAAPLAAGTLYAVTPGLPFLVALIATIPVALWAFALNRRWPHGRPAAETAATDEPFAERES